MNVAKIGKNMVKNVSTGELCRLYSRRLSVLTPQLTEHNVRMIGVGLEELGLEEFVEGKYFDGELFIDSKKKCYQELGFKRLGFFSAIGSVLGKKGREMLGLAKEQGISGNIKGDGMQNGGTIIVEKGGKVLLSYMQESPADHVSIEEVLNALSIGDVTSTDASASAPSDGMVCTKDACART